jgi:hypothetical protein
MGVSEVTSLQEPPFGMSQSPLWASILDRVGSQISGGRQVRGSGPSSLDGTASALARAHSHFLVALEGGSKVGQDTVSQLVTEAVELILAVARIWGSFGARAEDRRASLVDQLRRRLAAQEDAVLAGEVTYSVWAEHAEEPSAAMRQAISCLSRKPTPVQGDLVSLTIAAVDLASLLVRLAANVAASGRGGEAPERRSGALDAKLGAVTADLAARAQNIERPLNARSDVVAHHLAAGLRVRFSQGMLTRLSAGSPAGAPEAADLEGLRDAWLRLATNEYVAVAALDAQLDRPCSDNPSGSLSKVIDEGAANVICGARLIGRPGAFRQHRAWRHQAVALTYALEAYVAGLRGHAPSLTQARLIALTRLVRATVAIVLIDLAVDTPPTDRSIRG